MAFEFAMLPGEPVMLTKFHPDFNVQDDTPVVLGLMTRALDAAPARVTIVANLLGIQLKFSDMVYALGIVTKGDTAVLHHPCVRRLALITTSDTIRFGGYALQQEQYGSIPVDFYTTQEEALKAIHAAPGKSAFKPPVLPITSVVSAVRSEPRAIVPLRTVAKPADVGQWF
jgi:hypothetical protein